MIITKGCLDDLNGAIEIINQAKAYFKSQNIDQWQDGYPNEDVLVNDINNDALYAVKKDDKLIALFALYHYESTYENSNEVSWSSGKEYVVVHRIAIKNECKGQGVAKFIFDYVKSNYDYIRIDTHPDNKNMISCIYKNGFTYRGKIYLERPGFNLRYAYDYLSN